jgi:MFS family permease
MMVDFKMADTIDEAGYSSGWIMTMFMIGRLCSAVLWGIASDRYGRKICLIISMCSACVFSLTFGFSTSFSFAIVIRFLTGFFNGFIGISKTYLCEIVNDKEQETRAFAYFSGVQGLGLIIGPMIGGLLARPALQYPSMFPSQHLFSRYPYLLPSLASAILSLIAVIGISIFLPETLGTVRRKDVEKEKEKNEQKRSGIKYDKIKLNEEDCYDNDLEDNIEMMEIVEIQAQDVNVGSSVSSATNKNDVTSSTCRLASAAVAFLPSDDVLMLIATYSLLCFVCIIEDELFPLYAVTSLKNGGLAWNSLELGETLALTGIIVIFFQFVCYEKIVKLLFPSDEKDQLSVSLFLSAVVIGLFPVAADVTLRLFSISSGKNIVLRIVVIACLFLFEALTSMSFTSVTVLLNNSVDSSIRGQLNGFVTSAGKMTIEWIFLFLFICYCFFSFWFFLTPLFSRQHWESDRSNCRFDFVCVLYLCCLWI